MMNDGLGFNLLDEPWIVVIASDNKEREVSILELFERSPELLTIGGEVPTQGFAITRLLLAFLHRALDGPKDQDEWSDLWRAEDLPMDRIRPYADRVRHRFDLFDPAEPFFQVPDLRTAKGEVSGLEKMVADVPSGEPMFSTRSAGSLRRISAAEAARWLVHVHAFDVSGIKSGAVGDPKVKGGKGYPIGPGWSGQIGGVLPEGVSLYRTLLLNLVGADVPEYVRIGGTNDLPPWERLGDGPSWDEDRPVRGAIDLYTWQTRRVRLVGDRDGVIGVVLANGDKMTPQNRHTIDPHTSWRYSEPQTKKLKQDVYMPRSHDPSRSVWRGLEALLPSVSGRHGGASEPSKFLAPGVLQWLGELVGEGILPETFVVRTRMVGANYGTQNATFDEMTDDRLPLVLALLREDDPALGAGAVSAVADAERAASALWRFAENLVQAAGGPGKAGAGDLARQELYSRLESPYRRWLSDLVPGSDPQEARARWQRTVRESNRPVVEDLLYAAGPAAWIGRTISKRLVNAALAEAWFNAALRKALPLVFAGTDGEVA